MRYYAVIDTNVLVSARNCKRVIKQYYASLHGDVQTESAMHKK